MEEEKLYKKICELLVEVQQRLPNSPVMRGPSFPRLSDEHRAAGVTERDQYIALGNLTTLSLAFQQGPFYSSTSASFAAAFLCREALRRILTELTPDYLRELGNYLVYEEPEVSDDYAWPEALELHAWAACQILVPLIHEDDSRRALIGEWREEAKQKGLSELHLDRLEQLLAWYAEEV